MSTRDTLVNEIQSIGAVIRHARAGLDAGELIDVSPLEARVDKLCRSLGEAAADDAAHLRGGVLALIDDFGQLAGLIDARLADLRKDLADTGGRTRAVSAYGKAGQPGKPRR